LVFYGGCGFIATAIIAEIAATEITCDHDRDHDDVVVPASTVRFQKGGINRMPGAVLKPQSRKNLLRHHARSPCSAISEARKYGRTR
jgi:hypothetical protein